MAVQPFLVQRQKEPEEKKKDALDYLLIGLDVANKGFGIASSYESIKNAQSNRDLNALEQTKLKRDLNLQASGYKPTDTTDKLKVDERTPGAAKVQELAGYEGDAPKFKDGYYVKKPKADYGSQKEVDELVSKGNFRYGSEGEKGAVKRSVLLPSNEMGSVLLVDTGPEKLAATRAEKEAERGKDIYIAKLGNESKMAANEFKKNSKDASYDSLPKESKIQIDKIAGSMGDVTAVKNSLAADLEQYKKAKTEAEKITIGESMIKTLNSKMGKDAVGVEEAARLAPYLTYQKGNVFGPGSFIGRDLPAFQKQVEASLAGLDQSIQLGSDRINELKGIPKAQSEAPVAATPPTSQDMQAYQWASANILSPDPQTRMKAEAILKTPAVSSLAQKQNQNQIPGGGAQAPMLGFGRR